MIISGIQQIGIGVKNVKEAWRWYRDHFGMEIRMFEEEATANYMKPYTGGKPRARHAALALNMMGGGGFEIWQYTERTPEPASFEIKAGDLGIFAAKMKSPDVKRAYAYFKKMGITMNGISKDPSGRENFFVRDPYGNIFQVIEADSFFMSRRKYVTGAAYGAVIGTSDVEKARKLYSDVLGYTEVKYDTEQRFDDFSALPGGDHTFRRVLLKHTREARKGHFSRLFGPTEIELIQVKDREPQKIFTDRYWGDLGFIHLCYDITGMDKLENQCNEAGFPFTVDSQKAQEGKSFDMGEAAGHFAYVEDPDGTLVEFVETHKIPISKRLGWYLNLSRRRDVEKPVKNWVLKMLRFMKVRDKHLA